MTDAQHNTGPRTAATPTGLFTRNATGLVRGVSQRSAFVINFIPGHPVEFLAAGFFFVFALWPGGNYLLGFALVVPLILAMAYSFGLLTSMIPRSGGDYMIVSRVLHPLVGLVSSFCMTLAELLSIAYFAIAFITLGIGPGLVTLGLVHHSTTLINWGIQVQASNYWKFGLGAGMLVISAAFLAGSWKLALRIQNILFWVVTGGLVVAVLAALFTSHGSFVSSFNHFVAPYTHSNHTYQAVIAKAVKTGVNVSPGFSFARTIPVAGFFATFAIFSFWSTFVGGELRQGSTVKTAHNMALAGVSCVAFAALFGAIFLHTFGTSFMIAANAPTGGLPSQIATAPTFFFLISGSVGSTIFAVILILSYLFFWPLSVYVGFLQPTRTIFAYAFDGILPERVSDVSNAGSPWVALIVSWVLSAATLLWALNAASFLQVLTYATLIELIAMGLVSVAGIVVPYLRPQIYRGSATQRRFLRVPVVTIAGTGGVLTCVFIWVLFFHYASQFGFTDSGKFFGFVGGTIGAAVLFYLGARWVRARGGVNLDLVYAEIPPE
jgi:basic amino acid/polyamine antiporter, APA family